MFVTSLSGAFTGCIWDIAQSFAVRTGAATPEGLGLDSKTFGDTLKKAGEERAMAQWRAALVA